ncbi:hypothetical protein HPB49_022588 [Dermacentor silvarum]|uniref:Uncharacterized protein n=1 Tax=Dermacentor silvarum TaxID=543639 RepID=A0ACB8D0V1_DERSI|nr:hypothetical protein HPB49_022588 [Dermacentor silvarum]
MKSVEYEVRLELSAHERKIVQAYCTCKAGCRGWCKHGAALALYVNNHQHTSCTDLPCAWQKPSTRPTLDTKKSISELFPSRPIIKPILRPLSPTVVHSQFPDVNCAFRWHTERHLRITSSSAHRIKTRLNNYKTLASSLVRPRFFSSAATSYGKQMETEARAELSTALGAVIHEVGLFIHPEQPWLCCSPDGILDSDGRMCLVEIKCPFSLKDKKLIDHEHEESFVPYIHYKHKGEGKRSLGGKGRLTAELVDRLAVYYGRALKSHVGDVEAMSRAVMATFYHVTSTDSCPNHALCPAVQAAVAEAVLRFNASNEYAAAAVLAQLDMNITPTGSSRAKEKDLRRSASSSKKRAASLGLAKAVKKKHHDSMHPDYSPGFVLDSATGQDPTAEMPPAAAADIIHHLRASGVNIPTIVWTV